MRLKANDIIKFINTFAPEDSQEDWDNSGLQIGDINHTVNKILLTMDVTDKSIDYATENGYDMIISHHPFFFDSIKKIDLASYKGKIIKKIIDRELIVYSAHTNLDKSNKGINTALANKLGLKDIEPFTENNELSIGIHGELEDMSLENILNLISDKIVSKEFIRVYGNENIEIKRIGLIGGSGASMLNQAIKQGANLLITGDVKHHDGQYAYEENVVLIDISHYYSEYPGLELLKKELENVFDIDVGMYENPVFFIGH